LDYLRISVIVELLLFPIFLLATAFWFKLIMVGLLGFFNSGWYAILKANLFSSLPGKSGSVLALDSITGLFGKLIPFGIGSPRKSFGLGFAMWLFARRSDVLLIGLPRKKLPS